MADLLAGADIKIVVLEWQPLLVPYPQAARRLTGPFQTVTPSREQLLPC